MAGTSEVTNQQSGLFTEWTGQLSNSWKIHRRQLKWIITELFPLLNYPLRTSTHVKKTHKEVGPNVQVSKRQVNIHMLKCKYKPLVTMKSKKTRTEKFWQMKPRVTWYSYQNDGMRKLWRRRETALNHTITSFKYGGGKLHMGIYVCQWNWVTWPADRSRVIFSVPVQLNAIKIDWT